MWDAGDDDDDGDGRGEFWTERLRVEALGVKVATKSCPGREFFFSRRLRLGLLSSLCTRDVERCVRISLAGAQ